MNKYREYMKNRTFTKWVFFIVFTAALLYLTYFILRDFNSVVASVSSVIRSIAGAFSPLWIGLVLAYIINPMVEYIDLRFFSKISSSIKNSKNKSLGTDTAEKGKITLTDKHLRKLEKAQKSPSKTKSRLISILVTYIIIFMIIIAVIYGFFAMIVGELVITNIPDMINSLIKLIMSYESEFRLWANSLPSGLIAEYANNIINSLFSWFGEHFSATGILTTVSGLSNVILNFVLGMIVSIYLLIDKDTFLGIWKKFIYLIAPLKHEKVNDMLKEIDSVLSSFIKGVLIDSLCVAILSSIGLSLLGLRFAVFIGVFAGLANVIPYFGPILGMIPAFFVGIFTDSLLTGILSIITLFIVQQIDSNLIYPKVVGSSTGLKPLFVLLAVSVAGHYGGIFGMLLAVPAAGIIQIFVLKFIEYRTGILESKYHLTQEDNITPEEDTSKHL